MTSPVVVDGAALEIRQLSDSTDPLDLWEPGAGMVAVRPRRGLVTVGEFDLVATTGGHDSLFHLAVAAQNRLAELLLPGTPQLPLVPLVAGGIPFDPERPTALVIPAVTVARQGAETWRLAIRPEGRSPLPWRHLRVAATAGAVPSTVDSQTGGADVSEDAFAGAVATALERIARGELDKVVLARRVTVELPASTSPRAVLERLRGNDPACLVYGVGNLVGATPELCVRRLGDRVLSLPHAGTAPRSSHPATDREAARRLLASTKDRREHQLVVDAVVDALRPFCSYLQVSARPRLTATRRAWHLATPVRGRLRPPAADALSLAAALHPTPAVAGRPRPAALATISELEPFDRGLYAGLVGWTDARGDGEWWVALRCASLNGSRACLYAGCGIVAGSRPEAEVEETEVKLRTLRDALV